MTNSIMGASLTRSLTADQLEQEGKGFGLLDTYTDSQGNEYVFLQADASGVTGEGYAVTYLPTGVATMTAAGEALTVQGAPVAIAKVAVGASEYAWFQVKGFCNLQVTAAAAANVTLAATATAGQLDDAVGKTIQRCYLTTTRGAGAGLAPAVLTYPAVGATTT